MSDSPTPAPPSSMPTNDKLAELGERYFQTQHSYDPFNATLLGLNEFDHLVGDPSRAASESAADTFVEIADELSALDPSSLSDRDQVDHSVLAVLLRGAEGDARHSLWAANASAKSYVSRQGLVFQAIPAMADLIELMRTELMPVGRPNDQVGIKYVPGGAEGYQSALARHTTTALTAEQIHQIGLDALAELAPRWSEVGQRAIGESDFPTLAARMRADPALRCESRAQIVEIAETALHRAQAVQHEYFPTYGIPNCIIEEINPIDATNAALAYYRPPAVDGSRPGAHCLLTSEPATRFRFEYECLAFHESVPGHHLQLATAQLLDIPRYRRYLDVEACSFNEGWGLYCEQFADEVGLYSSDIDLLGMLSFAALRACRLVVDTGIHYYGWSRERAIDFMWQNTVTTEANVRNEIDRYVAWPGQAVSYMIGKREILRLRELAKSALGEQFEIRDFHKAVLENGAVPLPVLGSHISRWQADVGRK